MKVKPENTGLISIYPILQVRSIGAYRPCVRGIILKARNDVCELGDAVLSGTLIGTQVEEVAEVPVSAEALKVLEDKRAFFESTYYDPADPKVPPYIKKLFDEGAPADFVLIGATTRQGLLSAPLRARFKLAPRLDYYDPENLRKIVQRSAGILNVGITPEAAFEIARRSRGTPRIANNLLSWARDFAQVRGNGTIDDETARNALSMMEIDSNGLDEMDKRILETIVANFNGGPVGLNSLAVAIGEDPGTIEEVYEPYLIQEGYLMRSPQGRIATDKSWSLFGLSAKNRLTGRGSSGRKNDSDQPDFFQ